MKTEIPELNQQIAANLVAQADTMLKSGKDKFKVLAYQKAARAINQEPRNLWGVYRAGGLKALQKIKGIGPRLAWVIVSQIKASEKK
jgi:DNA polymerase/3'-5' exonuclease PolX